MYTVHNNNPLWSTLVDATGFTDRWRKCIDVVVGRKPGPPSERHFLVLYEGKDKA